MDTRPAEAGTECRDFGCSQGATRANPFFFQECNRVASARLVRSCWTSGQGRLEPRLRLELLLPDPVTRPGGPDGDPPFGAPVLAHISCMASPESSQPSTD